MDIKQINRKGEKKEKREKEKKLTLNRTDKRLDINTQKHIKVLEFLEMWLFFFLCYSCAPHLKNSSLELNYYLWFGLAVLF
jgi:hypothetical protein